MEEIPRNQKALVNALCIDYFARINGMETIRSFNLMPGQISYRTGNTYTIWTRKEVLDKPEKIFSVYPGNFTDVYDVLNHARKRNDAIIIVGADGANCVKDAARAVRMIFPQTYLVPDAIHFDFPTPYDRSLLSAQAKEVSFLQAVSIMGGLHA